MWKLDGTDGSLEVAGMGTRVDVAHPEQGFLSSASNGRVMQLLPAEMGGAGALKLTEAYIRGNDLVALYEPLAPHQVQPQVYWRARFDEGKQAVGVEMIVSMQTSLLDSNPETVVATGMPIGDVWGPAKDKPNSLERLEYTQFPLALSSADGSHRPSLVVYQPRDTSFAYIEMVHPADFVATQVELNKWGESWATTRLFSERLEKGVIRRARIAGWHVPRKSDVLATAADLYAKFAAEPLPLTT
ncbi:MAG: hypothetical protein K8R36_15920 [Planctomycetales bacterium]|nr:hypothetical protein [Planctomycetales bacterium]